jgi:CBS domain-containing protein
MISAILKGKGTEVVSVGPGDPVLAVARVLTERGIGAALVRDPRDGCSASSASATSCAAWRTRAKARRSSPPSG